jgi:hypothetical protein
VDILKPYFENDLKPDIPSDISIGESVTLNKPNKKILLGFLTGLGTVVTECSVLLDPSDPNTYKSLFSGLGSKLVKRWNQFKKVNNEQDAKEFYQQDSADMGEKLDKIRNKIQELVETKKETILRIQERDEQLSKQKDLSALKQKQLFEEKEEFEQQLIGYECSMSLYQREEESILNRQKNLQFIHNDTNLYLFYHTVENRLESLFHAVLAAQSGELQTTTQTKNSATTRPLKTVPSSALLAFGE